MPLQVKLEVDKAGDVLWLVQQQYKIQILLSFPSHWRQAAGTNLKSDIVAFLDTTKAKLPTVDARTGY